MPARKNAREGENLKWGERSGRARAKSDLSSTCFSALAHFPRFGNRTSLLSLSHCPPKPHAHRSAWLNLTYKAFAATSIPSIFTLPHHTATRTSRLPCGNFPFPETSRSSYLIATCVRLSAHPLRQFHKGLPALTIHGLLGSDTTSALVRSPSSLSCRWNVYTLLAMACAVDSCLDPWTLTLLHILLFLTYSTGGAYHQHFFEAFALFCEH